MEIATQYFYKQTTIQDITDHLYKLYDWKLTSTPDGSKLFLINRKGTTVATIEIRRKKYQVRSMSDNLLLCGNGDLITGIDMVLQGFFYQTPKK